MEKFEFTIIASGLDHTAKNFFDNFYEAGCDDSTIGVVKGLIVLEFAREAKNFAHALVSAVRDVRKTGATVRHIEPDYLVSLSDIAERCNLSRAAPTLFAKGERGQNFPAPIARVATDSPLWDWVEVARWMYQRGKLSLSTLVQAKIVSEANRALSETHGRLEDSRIGQKLLAKAA
jgi:hypothetical protein